MGVLYPFVLSPEVAALSMSGSILIVAVNALMLKRTKLAGIIESPIRQFTGSRRAGYIAGHGQIGMSGPTCTQCVAVGRDGRFIGVN